MSISLVTDGFIRNHQANKSPSKQAHIFPKTKRFLLPNPECPLAFYTCDSQLSKRKTSFGYGPKSDFTRPTTVSPPATKYEIKSFVQIGNKKGKSFGLQREKLPNNSYLIPQLHKNPAPGTYDNDKLKVRNLSFTCRPRTIDHVATHVSYLKSPGPGAYRQIDCEPKNGRFSVSKYSDTKFATINPNSPRFLNSKESPGPSLYKQGDNLNGESKYILSSRKGNGTRVFSKTARFSDGFWKNASSINPGPGNYHETSQFGIYGDTNYYKTLNSK